jgi:hypothetical protein
MANWDKLNEEFDALIEGTSKEDWERWDANRVAKREFRKETILLKAEIRGRLLSSQQFVNAELETGTIKVN